MSKTTTISRIFFGIFLLVFGLNGFLNFNPLPSMTEQAGEFMGALSKAGYIMPIVGILEVIVGLLLIFNKFVPLSLIVIFSIMLNAFLFHLVLDIGGIGGSLIAISLNIFLFIAYKENYKNIFKVN
jgi:putative oxidoreductase